MLACPAGDEGLDTIEIPDACSDILYKAARIQNDGIVSSAATDWHKTAWLAFLEFCAIYDMLNVAGIMLSKMARHLDATNITEAFVWAARFDQPHVAAQLILRGSDAARAGVALDPFMPSFPHLLVDKMQPRWLHTLWRVCSVKPGPGQQEIDWVRRAGQFMKHTSESLRVDLRSPDDIFH